MMANLFIYQCFISTNVYKILQVVNINNGVHDRNYAVHLASKRSMAKDNYYLSIFSTTSPESERNSMES